MTQLPEGAVRVTVNLTPRANAARQAIQEQTGDNMTDIINRGLSVYAVVLDLLARSEGDSLTVANPDGTTERVYLV